MSRNRVLVLALAGVAAAGAAGWVAGTQVQSSKEAAASAEPPLASAVTAAVKKMELASTIVTRGNAAYGQSAKVNLPAGGGASLVTSAPEAGRSLAEGDSFMEANGQPVFALLGGRPMYRDLGPGDTGEDVRQLEEALARLGLNPGPVDGTYDSSTAAAVGRLYARAGYSAPGQTDAERAEIRSATSVVDQAQNAVTAAKRQLAEGTKPPTELELLQAEVEVRNAEEAIANAKVSAADKNRAAEREVSNKADALAAAHEKAAADEAAAKRLVSDREAAVTIAQENVYQAYRASSPEGAGGQSARAAILQAENALKTAKEGLADAKAALEKLPAESAKSIALAQRALDDAKAAVPRTKSDGEAAIRSAETAASISALRLKNLNAPRTSEALTASVADAETALAKAQKTLSEAQVAAGTKLGSNSVVYFAQLPVRIDSVKVKHGDPATGEIMTVSASSLVVDAAVTVAEAKFLSPGMEVQIEAPDLQISLKGKISTIAEKPGTNGLDAQHVAIKIEPIDPPANFKDAAVKVTIPVKSTAGKVLVVPVAAVSSGADGSAYVEIVDESESHRQVKVAVGLSSQGLVEISALDGSIAEGDRAVVGAK